MMPSSSNLVFYSRNLTPLDGNIYFRELWSILEVEIVIIHMHAKNKL